MSLGSNPPGEPGVLIATSFDWGSLMLQELSVRNLALIDRLNVRFSPGFNVLTGPTGSGKSLLLRALRLALGERADYDLLSDSDPARVTAIFDPPEGVQFPDYDPGEELFYRRVLKPEHRSPAYLNDERIRLKKVRSQRKKLIDFHGQHENQVVFDPEFPRRVLDRYGDYGEILEAYRDEYREFRELREELDRLTDPDSEVQQRLELKEYQLDELEEFSPEEGEWEEIEERRVQLESAEETERRLRQSLDRLEQGESVPDQLDKIQSDLREIEHVGDEISDWVDELENIRGILEEMRQRLREFRDDISGSEQEFDELMNRRGRWMELARKHTVPPERLYEEYRDIATTVEELRNREQRVDEIRERLGEIESRLRDQAEGLRDRRRTTAEELQSQILDRLRELNLEEALFEVRVDGDELGPHGGDSVRWFFSSHDSQRPGPLKKRVSGGEISRVLLAVKAALAEADQTPVLVFDEIDTGISGEEADRVGKTLAELAEYHQVLCITHLPLVAAHADRHIRVDRVDQEGNLDVSARVLDHEDRVDEISRLLSGDDESDLSQQQADELLSARIR